MTQPTLDERVAALELVVAKLVRKQADEQEHEPPESAWRSTVGMFAGDDIMKEIIEEGRRIREQDREQTRQ